MKTARIVVGANLGDEGKGTVVAKLTKGRQNVLNILTNGGSQRGHSVITDIGEHTFHHFGSGTYFGASNYYSSFFIINPMQFKKEWDELIVKPTVFRDRKCRWSTPFDMIANTIMEERKNTHGSCRMGIWNTVRRCAQIGFRAFDEFMEFPEKVQIDCLEKIRKYYEDRIIMSVPDEWKSIWNNPYLITHFLEDCKFMYEHTVPVCADDSRLDFDEYIFENGQGLLLDDNGKDLSDRTPSKTGSVYSLLIMEDMKLKDCDIKIHYVTRPYLTRHGDGVLEKETKMGNISSGISSDRTNVRNEGQGDFRYAPLDIDALGERITQDSHGHDFIVELTHCDEMDRLDEFEKKFEKVKITDTPVI